MPRVVTNLRFSWPKPALPNWSICACRPLWENEKKPCKRGLIYASLLYFQCVFCEIMKSRYSQKANSRYDSVENYNLQKPGLLQHAKFKPQELALWLVLSEITIVMIHLTVHCPGVCNTPTTAIPCSSSPIRPSWTVCTPPCQMAKIQT